MVRNNVKKSNQGGYTIIETMIAVSLFVIIVTLGLGVLLNASAVHSKTQKMRSIMDSLTFAMEDMSRNLRTGSNYHCVFPNQASLPTTPRSCATGIGVAFEESGGVPGDNSDQWVYYVNLGKLYKMTNGGATAATQLTPDEVVISSISNFVTIVGAEPPPGDLRQPLVTIRLAGTITYKGIITPFNLQTSVSQRAIDI